MLIGDIFANPVTRAINPVVYFHEQDPAKVAEEVSEYIITGGYPEGDPRANPDGIHEQFVRLLRGMRAALDQDGGPGLPASWISGFYGSGKSSFAKLLGLSLGGLVLPDGKPLSQALLERDMSDDRRAFHLAYHALLDKVGQSMAVVFDIGSAARDDEHIHAAVVRECQKAMGYCSTSNLVADHEMKLEADDLWPAFLDKTKETHGKPWSELKDKQLAEDHFSAVLHALSPMHYDTPTAWLDAVAGRRNDRSAEECVLAIEHMLTTRYPGRALFLVVDEVSQYVHDNKDRMLGLQSLVSALGQRLRGKVWLLATGQQKLEEGASATTTLGKLKDRFPANLRVHLGSANIRDVVYQRLLKKKETVREELAELYINNRPDLELYAYKCDEISQHDFVDIYPLLPGHIDLLMQITTGLRARSSRVQGDSHAIRGLLQLLGDLFRDQELVKYEVGTLITLDRIYDVLHTALDADVQTTLARALDYCKKNPEGHLPEAALVTRVLKAVSLLELIQDERVKTDVDLIGRSLYERVGQGSQQDAIQAALDALRAKGFLDYSEKTGYKIQSSAGQEWRSERDKYAVGTEKVSAKVQDALGWISTKVESADLGGVPVPWQAWFSDSISVSDAPVKRERSTRRIEVDFRFLQPADAKKDDWIPKSSQNGLKDRILWVAGDIEGPRAAATEYIRSARMIERAEQRGASLKDEQKRLLAEERNRLETARQALSEAVEKAFLSGTLYFRGKDTLASDEGSTFSTALKSFGDRVVRKLYPSPITFRVSEGDLKFLIESADLAGPPPVLGEDKLGVLVQDSGRYEATCTGTVPMAIYQMIDAQPGTTGSTLLSAFGGPPHGYASDVVKASIVGLLRGRKVRIQIPGLGELTSARDEGSRELLKDQTLRKAELFPNKDDAISGRDRNAICALFKDQFNLEVPRNDEDIVAAIPAAFAAAREQLTELQGLLVQLPGKPQPETLRRLERALEQCRRDRRIEPTLKALKRSLGDLRDGLTEMRRLRTDITESVVKTVSDAASCRDVQLEQLKAEVDAGHLAANALETVEPALEAALESPRPWEHASALEEHTQAILKLYQNQRRQILSEHETSIERAADTLKLRAGFDTLSQDDQYQVLSHVRDGAPFETTAAAVAPSLAALRAGFSGRLQAAINKALSHFDELRESHGDKPTVTVSLGLRGRELENIQELERFLEELRKRLLAELEANHRVRLT